MDPTDLQPLLERLDDDMDGLEDVLQIVLGKSLHTTSNKLPVMDKAKLYVTITYTLESLLFSYLRLHGVDAKQHPVFRELIRVKQYFEKIKTLETEPEERTMTLDKAAAGRFIKHGLAGNDKYDLERAEKQAKERARAQFKADMLAKKSMNAAKQQSDEDSEDDVSEGGEDNPSAAASEVDTNLPSKIQNKKSNKKSTADLKPDTGKSKKERKINKATLKQEKKERRQKKEETRKARKAQ